MTATSDTQRKQNEIAHGKAIVSVADRVWQRNTVAGQKRLENRFDDLCLFFGRSIQGRLLELGCGSGIWTQILSRTPVAITSIELSEDLLALARSRCPDPQIHFICGDAENLSLENNSFDYVCGLSILHHLSIEKALQEVYRVLKPGGKAWFSEPNMLNPQIMIQKNVPPIKRWAGDTPDETAFFRWPLKRQFKQAGFQNVDIKPFDFLHPQIPAFATSAMNWTSRQLERLPVIREIAGSLLIHVQK
jgi:SAM-dependent methyltransferase